MGKNQPKAGGKKLSEHEGSSVNLAGLLNLFVVYLVWGSTYLAIRVAVRPGAGFPPFMMGAFRMFAAGSLILLWGFFTRSRLRLTKRELVILAVSGVFLWLGGTGLVIWAETRAESAYAALLIGTAPLWMALMGSLADRKVPSLRLIASILVGFAGISLLSAPKLLGGTRADIYSVIALLFAPIFWSAGSIFQRRNPVELTPVASSGWQHIFGGVGFLIVLLFVREPLPVPTLAAWWAWAYLVVFGSIIAFTCYIQALHMLPISIAMTYAYVNPVIAVFLGRLILNESVTVWTIAGTTLVLLGVAGVFREQYFQETTMPVVRKS